MAVRIVYNTRGIGKLLRDPALKADLRARAQRVARAAGPGYAVVEGEGRTRSRAAVVTRTAAAVRQNARSNTLLRALNAGRG